MHQQPTGWPVWPSGYPPFQPPWMYGSVQPGTTMMMAAPMSSATMPAPLAVPVSTVPATPITTTTSSFNSPPPMLPQRRSTFALPRRSLSMHHTAPRRSTTHIIDQTSVPVPVPVLTTEAPTIPVSVSYIVPPRAPATSHPTLPAGVALSDWVSHGHVDTQRLLWLGDPEHVVHRSPPAPSLGRTRAEFATRVLTRDGSRVRTFTDKTLQSSSHDVISGLAIDMGTGAYDVKVRYDLNQNNEVSQILITRLPTQARQTTFKQ